MASRSRSTGTAPDTELHLRERHGRRHLSGDRAREANGEIINIGSTQEITILDLARRIKRLSGTPGELDVEFVPYASFTGRKYEDVMRRVPDVAHCERLLGVRARVDIDDGLTRTIEWQRAVSKLRAAG